MAIDNGFKRKEKERLSSLPLCGRFDETIDKESEQMRIWKIIVYGGMILALGSTAGYAQGDTVSYAVQAVLPENQMNGQVSYFDLKVAPGQHQTLRVVVKNKSDEEIKVAIKANTAFSNGNGLIEYSHTDARDASLKVDFAKIIVPVAPVITIPANAEAVAEFVLTTPDEPFEGDVLGGFMFTKLDQARHAEGASVSIQNVYQYVIGVRLRESEEAVNPLFELVGVEENEPRKRSLLLHLRNSQPIIASGIELDVRIYPQDGTEPACVFERSHLAMAPNSTMAYHLRLGDQDTLQPGAYRVSVALCYEDDTWSFETPLIVR